MILKAILQLESQEKESAMETVFMVVYTSQGMSNEEQTSWLSWSNHGGLRKSRVE